MYVFGGMCGARLDDLWQLDLGKLTLIQAQELVMIDKDKCKNRFWKIFLVTAFIELHLDLQKALVASSGTAEMYANGS